MGQILAKYNQGSLGWAEIADSLIDPNNSFSYINDFTTSSGYTLSSIGTGTSTATIQAAHGGTVLVATATTSTANDQGAIGTTAACFTPSANRRAYIEFRFTSATLIGSTTNWVMGLTAAAPSTTVFSTTDIAVPANSIIIGRDQGTDSGLTANKNIEIQIRGASGAAQTQFITLPATLVAGQFYRLGFTMLGNTVQVWWEGKKVGTEMRFTVAPTAAMGVYAAVQTTNTTSRSIELDYIVSAFTR